MVKEYWRKMIPKLGLTAENMKSYEEAKSDESGMLYNKGSSFTERVKHLSVPKMSEQELKQFFLKHNFRTCTPNVNRME